ncbi:conjugal transfer protein TraG [Aeromonas veronii]|nr:type IV secretion system protein [Aeromonas veronii]OLF56776.1 conjugal transfer protein TraG [Aeromonas veronii]OLF56828.1 conjugal transfer protein TraG [Aeromonas veronii]
MSEQQKERYYEENKKDAEKGRGKRVKETAAYYEAVKNFEQEHINALVQQRKHLIRGLACTGAIIVLQAVALACLAPLKTAVPYVIRVDNSTGYTDIVKSISDENSSYDEVMKKYWLSQYVINYESYDWLTVQTLYDNIKLLSTSDVFGEYRTKMLADNSPLNLLKDNYKLKTKIKSVTFLNKETAQVRFTKMVLNKKGELAPEFVPTDWVAVVAFDFSHEIKTEGERLLNPLGFNVLSYRVDPEAGK